MLIRHGPHDSWHEPERHGYDSESELQALLGDHPALIPGLDPGAAVCREFQSGVGPADIVLLGPDGDLTVVECKRAANPQVRRETLIPTTFAAGPSGGAGSAARVTGRPEPWNVDDYLAVCASADPPLTPTIDALLRAIAPPLEVQGGRAATPSLRIDAQIARVGRISPFALYSNWSGCGEPTLEIRFGELTADAEIADRFAVAVTALPDLGLTIDEVRIARYRKRPNVPLRSMTPDDASTLMTRVATALTI